MKIPSQIIVCIATLLGALFMGSFYLSAFWQAEFYAKDFLNGKPLPVATQFFINNSVLAFYLCLLPWLWLVGAPLLTRISTRNYWDASAFVLRCLAFLSCEGLLLLLLTFFLYLPYITAYSMLRGGGKRLPELVGGLLFWGIVAGLICLSIWRFYQSRHVRLG